MPFITAMYSCKCNKIYRFQNNKRTIWTRNYIYRCTQSHRTR